MYSFFCHGLRGPVFLPFPSLVLNIVCSFTLSIMVLSVVCHCFFLVFLNYEMMYVCNFKNCSEGI